MVVRPSNVWTVALLLASSALGQGEERHDALRRLQQALAWSRAFELRLAVEVTIPPMQIDPGVLSQLYGPVPADPARRAARSLAMARSAKRLARTRTRRYAMSARLSPDGHYFVSIRDPDGSLHESAYDGSAYWECTDSHLVSPYLGRATVAPIEDVVAHRGDPRGSAGYTCRLRYALNVFCLVPDAIGLGLKSGSVRLDETDPSRPIVDVTLPWPRRDLCYTNATRVRAVLQRGAGKKPVAHRIEMYRPNTELVKTVEVVRSQAIDGRITPVEWIDTVPPDKPGGMATRALVRVTGFRVLRECPRTLFVAEPGFGYMVEDSRPVGCQLVAPSDLRPGLQTAMPQAVALARRAGARVLPSRWSRSECLRFVRHFVDHAGGVLTPDHAEELVKVATARAGEAGQAPTLAEKATRYELAQALESGPEALKDLGSRITALEARALLAASVQDFRRALDAAREAIRLAVEQHRYDVALSTWARLASASEQLHEGLLAKPQLLVSSTALADVARAATRAGDVEVATVLWLTAVKTQELAPLRDQAFEQLAKCRGAQAWLRASRVEPPYLGAWQGLSEVQARKLVQDYTDAQGWAFVHVQQAIEALACAAQTCAAAKRKSVLTQRAESARATFAPYRDFYTPKAGRP